MIPMRFHEKFGLSQGILCAMILLWVAAVAYSPHKNLWLNLWCLLLCLAELARWSATRWEIRPEGLWVRPYWHGHTIPWEQIQTVGTWRKFTSSGVLVESHPQHPAWQPIRHRLGTRYSHELIEQLRQHAPHAAIQP
jgi:hypothetical protein